MRSSLVASLLLTIVIIINSGIDGSSINYTTPQCEVRLRTDAGWVCGRIRLADDGRQYASFRGVPYAKPPLRELRFKELQPLDPWDGLRDATEDGPACPQKDFIYNRLVQQRKGMSEDCIWLNVHVPLEAFPKDNTRTGGGVPILVFVHGGAFQVGSGLTDLHGPEYLMRQNVIVITFNMRIGLFGFLSLNNEKIPGNQGLRDVLTLLRWVQRNAKDFGGNPNDVTLMGHSTGSVTAHLISLSEASRGLIHKVVLMSGTATVNTISMRPEHAKYYATKFLQELGIESKSPEYVHQRLTTEPLLNIMNAYNKVQITSGIGFMLTFTPVIETSFPNVTTVIKDDPKRLMEKQEKPYPLLLGFTNAEYNYFKWDVLAANPMEKVKTDTKILLPEKIYYQYPHEQQIETGRKIMEQYSLQNGTLDNYLEYLSDMVFVYAAIHTAETAMRRGVPVYLYQCSYEARRSIIKEALWSTYQGAAHVEDLTYVFKTNSLLFDYKSYPPMDNDDLMREWMPKIIANFVKCSSPTCAQDEDLQASSWPPLSENSFQYQAIDQPMVFAMQGLTPKQTEMKRFFDELLPEFSNRRIGVKNSNTRSNIQH